MLVVGAGLFTLFRGGTEEPAATTNTQPERTQPERMQPAESAANTVQANNDVAEHNQVVDAREGQTPLDEANPVSVSTPAATDVGSDDIRPPEMVARESQDAKFTELAGETPAIAASDGESPAPGVQKILGRTRWALGGGVLDKDGFTHPALEIIIDVKADFLEQVADFQMAEITVAPVDTQQPLETYDLDGLGGLLLSGRFVPYRHEAEDGLYGHPEGWLRVAVPVAIPPATTTALEFQGSLLLRVGANKEVIEINDVRAAAGKPLDQPSLRAAKAMLDYQSADRPPFGFRETFSFMLSPDYAVGKLSITTSRGEHWLKPHIEPRSQRVFYQAEIRGRPQGQLILPVTLFSDLSERSIPLHFESLPMPPADRKPNR